MTTHSSTLAWKIPWTEEPGRLRSMGLPRVSGWGREGMGVCRQEMQVFIYRMDQNKVQLYGIKSYSQYSVTNHNGKEYLKKTM